MEVLTILELSTSRSDAVINLGLKYVNSRTLLKLEKIALEYNFDLEIYKNKHISKCQNCGKEIKGTNRKFCDHSCSAKFNNSKRVLTDETKNKISKKLKGNIPWNKGLISDKPKKSKIRIKKERLSKSVIKTRKCKICEKEFTTSGHKQNLRLTCSDVCRIKASTERTYRNGSRKTIKYINKWYGEVILESSWELKMAEHLDENNIKWNRPKPIKWVDSNQKEHLYYPDFYLEDYDIYVDPKNKYCMVKDEEKMSVVSKKINVIYGDINKLIKKINNGSTLTLEG